jgi:hypothetical protein
VDRLIYDFLSITNETLAAAIAIVAVSLLLYNLSRNFQDRVARASGLLLLSVSAAYVCDVLLSLSPAPAAVLPLLRAQWIGIALAPAALAQLSDALLETTGLPSRGRRRRTYRLMILISLAFIVAAAYSDQLVQPIISEGRQALRAAPLMGVFLAFLAVACGFAFWNVDRARRRCLTRASRRRMAYLEVALLTPILGIFPFSAFFTPGGEFTSGAIGLVIVANIFVVLMLLFLSYPLAFFGSRIPDRAVKSDLLRFLLRGPATGMLIVAVMFFTGRTTRIFSLRAEEFTVFAVVAVVLFWQWMAELALPWLDRHLIFGDDDEQSFGKLQAVTRQMLTRDDLLGQLEGILAQLRNLLQTEGAFVAQLGDGLTEVIRATGSGHQMESRADELSVEVGALRAATVALPHLWNGFWLLPLLGQRAGTAGVVGQVIGALGVQHGSTQAPSPDEMVVLARFRRRAATTLEDLILQGEIFAALEGLLPQFTSDRRSSAELEYEGGRADTSDNPLDIPGLPDRDQIIEQVQAALRHYYGGPGLTKSRLLELAVVRRALPTNQNEPLRALRTVLDQAIELQRPPGDRDWRSQDWLIYNVLELRYIKKMRVRDTANRLYMSEANLYRKQNLAIEAVSDSLLRMEQDMLLSEHEEGV